MYNVKTFIVSLMKMASLSYGNISIDLRNFFLILYLIYISCSLLGFSLDLITYTQEQSILLIAINYFAITIALIQLILFFFKIIDLPFATSLFSYVFFINLFISDVYYAIALTDSWLAFIYRDAFLFTIIAVITGFICGRRHIYILNIAYLIMLIIIAIVTDGAFFKNTLSLSFLFIIGFTVTTVWYKKSIINVLNRNVNKQKEENRLNQEWSLQNHELLKNEIDYRTRELTEKSIRISENEATMTNVMKNLSELKKNNSNANAEINNLIVNIKQHLKDNSWTAFEHYFNQIHPDFYARLFEKYPDLTVNEKKLCAYLKLNMTTKDIATVNGKSINAIEVARTRLRKKLNIPPYQNLNNFMASI